LWRSRLCCAGLPAAQYRLALLLASGKAGAAPEAEVVALLHGAATRGHADAATALAGSEAGRALLRAAADARADAVLATLRASDAAAEKAAAARRDKRREAKARAAARRGAARGTPTTSSVATSVNGTDDGDDEPHPHEPHARGVPERDVEVAEPHDGCVLAAACARLPALRMRAPPSCVCSLHSHKTHTSRVARRR
jgi:hypothetical protein